MKIQVIESVLITPSDETPEHSMWLSNIDLPPVPKEYTPMVYLYRPNGDPEFFSVDRLKASLRRTLLHFYPLAGRLDVDQDGRTEINCTGEGALLVVARSECNLDEEFPGFVPSPELRKALVPPAESTDPPCVLLKIQVTYFKSGDVTLGVAFHHCSQDGQSMWHFINAWSDFTRSPDGCTDLAIPLSFDRTQLRAQPLPTTTYNATYEHKPEDFVVPMKWSPPPFTTALLHLSDEQLSILKSNKDQISTFRAVIAHMWRSMCFARKIAPDQNTWLYTFINARKRMNPPLPSGYFGNATLPTFACAMAGEVMTGSIEFAAEQIRSAVAKVDNEYVRYHIDCMEVGKSPIEWGLPHATMAVTSWLGMSIYEADFGWGKPEIMVRADMPAGGLGYILESSGGGVSVLVSLEIENMEGFKEAFYQFE